VVIWFLSKWILNKIHQKRFLLNNLQLRKKITKALPNNLSMLMTNHGKTTKTKKMKRKKKKKFLTKTNKALMDLTTLKAS